MKDALASAKAPADFRAVAVDAVKLIDQAISAGKQDIAKTTATVALSAARNADDDELVQTATMCVLEPGAKPVVTDPAADPFPDGHAGPGPLGPDAAGQQSRTATIGGGGGSPFEDVPEKRALLVGINLTTYLLQGHLVVKSVEPIYLAKRGTFTTKAFGKPNGAPVTIKARDGYAVGGIVAAGGGRVEELQIVFMRIRGMALDTTNSYRSDWIGRRGDGRETLLGGDGRTVVGIHGRCGADVDCLGLVQGRFAIPVGVVQATKKSPVPDAAAQEPAAKLIRELFHDKASAAATAEEQTALSQELLHKAQTTCDDVAAQYVLFKEAAQVAMQAKDVDQTFQVIEEMGARFEVDTLDLKVKSLTAMCKSSGTRQQSSAMVDSLLALMAEAATNESFDAAKQLGATAIDLARRSRESAFVKETASRIRAITADMAEIQAAQAEVEEAVGTLDTNPIDTAANLTVGQYRCFMKNLWRKGIPMLALGDDPALKNLAVKELKGVTDGAEQVKLADAWWELADKKNHLAKKNVLSHAAYCYQESVPRLTGLVKEKVEKRLAKLSAAGIGASDGRASQPANPEITLLLGEWDIAYWSYRGTWTFLKDGRVLSTNGPKEGKWSLEKSRVLIQWTEKAWDSFHRPLDSVKATGDSSLGMKLINAKKRSKEKTAG